MNKPHYKLRLDGTLQPLPRGVCTYVPADQPDGGKLIYTSLMRPQLSKRAFLDALNRLKVSLGVSKDKQVAHALGLSDKALNARKARDSFPETEVIALATRRPELKLDVTYVLMGAQPTPVSKTKA